MRGIAIVLLLALIGCATPKAQWDKAGVSTQQLVDDKMRCGYEAASNTPPSELALFGYNTRQRRQSLFDMCMMARGYQKRFAEN